jgi:hypothetical protein
MIQTIDIFKPEDESMWKSQSGNWNHWNQRWDDDKNAPMLNIVYRASTFGAFLKYFLDKFSSKTPEITKNPFTNTGTSHALQDGKYFSNKIQAYHQHFINDNEGETDLPVCLILPTSEKHFLYLKRGIWFRADDMKVTPDDLWKKAVGEMPEWLQEKAMSIKKLYDIKEDAHFSWIPKFIVRDWYKLDFLTKLEDTHNYRWFDTMKKHPFFKKQKLYHFDMEAFFDWQVFVETVSELNDFFDLSLDFDRMAEMKSIFETGLGLDRGRQECNLVIDALENNLDVSFKDLDVATEGYIYATLERQNPDIQMPLTNRFFRDPEEIKQFIEHFPNWYRRPNPNLG